MTEQQEVAQQVANARAACERGEITYAELMALLRLWAVVEEE